MNPINAKNKAEVLPLCYYGHPALREKGHDISETTDEVIRLSKKMIETMYLHKGIGLAGPQIGENLNIVVLDIPAESKSLNETVFPSPGEISLLPRMPLVLLNPKLSNFSEQKRPYVEGCLSIPGITAEVLRPEHVHLDSELLTGEKISYECGGLLARCIQHECDHLNGVLFVDLLSPDIFKSLKKNLRQIKKDYYQQ